MVVGRGTRSRSTNGAARYALPPDRLIGSTLREGLAFGETPDCMANTRLFLCLAMAFTVAAVGACGGASDLVAEPSEGDRGQSRSDSSANDDSVEAILEAGQQALRRDVTGRFVREVTYRPKREARSVIRQAEGTYDIEHRRARGEATLRDATGDDAPLPFEFASDGRRRIVRIVGWPCWVVLSRNDDSPIAELNPNPGSSRLPAEIAGFLLAEPTNFPDVGSSDVIEVMVPLRVVVGLVSTSIYTELAEMIDEIPVKAKIHLESGEFTSWSVRGDDLGYAIRMFTFLDDRDTDLSRVNVHVELSDVGRVGPIRLPPRSDRVRMPAKADDLDATACERTNV